MCRPARCWLPIPILVLLALPSLASPAITDIDFYWSSYLELAPGSDNFPLVWCEDGHQYTSWGDGGGFGGTNTEGRVSLGFGRVSGSYPSFQTQNLWGGVDAEAEPTFQGKVYSMLCIEGRLYGWHSPGSNVAALDYKQLIVSDDKGLTWHEDAFPNSRIVGFDGGPGLPYSIDYGKNYGANRDGYVYTYWVRIEDTEFWDAQKPGVLWLTRAPAADEAFTDHVNWKWYAGTSGGRPVWSSNPNARQPVLLDPEGFMRGSASYLSALDRYLMVTMHTAKESGNIAIWEAPKPWGPWSSVLREHGWPTNDPGAPVGPSFTFGAISPKWRTSDDRAGVLVFFQPDGWNSVAFTLPEPGTGTGLPLGAALLTWLARARRESTRPPL